MTAIVHSSFDCLDMDKGHLKHHDWLTTYSEQRLTNSNVAPIFLRVHGCGILVHKSHFERVGLYDFSLPFTLCIFGAGERGRAMLRSLRAYDIGVDRTRMILKG
jgi:hypothetical protein